MYELPKLNYEFNTLEPFIDAKTVEIHYTKHHQAYLDNLNKVLDSYPELNNKPIEELLRELPDLPVSDEDRKKIQNHGGGFYNHNLYWEIMNPKKQVDENLKNQIDTEFGSVENFKEKFNELAKTHFGSGWAWLVHDENKKLKIYSLPNQDSPLTLGHTPIITLDIWEHAYYLKYQNKRAEYIENWWNIMKLL